jgi:hypothetical protein
METDTMKNVDVQNIFQLGVFNTSNSQRFTADTWRFRASAFLGLGPGFNHVP